MSAALSADKIPLLEGCKWVKELQFVGNPLLLERKSVAIVGARDISPWWSAYINTAAAFYANNDFNVVSGGARGTDTAAVNSALLNLGTAVIVAASGINHFSYDKIKKLMPALTEKVKGRRKRMEESVDDKSVKRDVWSRILIVSPFEADEPWSGKCAMMRNEIICRLSSHGVIACFAKVGSGTANCGRTALRIGKPLFVPQFNGCLVPLTNLVGLGGVYMNAGRFQYPQREIDGKLVFDDGTLA